MYSLLPTTMLDNPVVERIKKLAEDEKGQVDKTKLCWMGFGVVFFFCVVLLLGSGASSTASSIDARTTLKMQQSKEILKRRSDMINDLRHDNDRIESTMKQQLQDLENELAARQDIVDQKAERVARLKEENLRLKSGNAATCASIKEAKEATIALREATIAEREATIVERDARIVALGLELTESEEKMTTYKALVAEKITQIENLHKKVKEHYEKVASLEEKVSEQGKKVSDKSDTLCEHDLKLLQNKVADLEQWKEDHTSNSTDPWRR